MDLGFDAPAMQPPAELPAAAQVAAALQRPQLSTTAQPLAVVLLVEIDARGV